MRFIIDFTSIIQPITQLLKKNVEFKWTKEAKDAFSKNKHSITSTPMMVEPNFEKEFIIYSYASKYGVVVSLL